MFLVSAHVFLIGRAFPLIKGTGYLRMELPYPEIISIGFSRLARLTPPGVLIMRPAGRISPLIPQPIYGETAAGCVAAAPKTWVACFKGFVS
jgi:hypothetical protein